MSYAIGIDVGTSSCKTVLVNSDGFVVASQTREYFPRSEEGNAFQNPEDWYRAATLSIRGVCEEADISARDVAVVGCTGQAQSTTFLDREGRVIRDSLLWFGLSAVEKTEQAATRYADLFQEYCHLGLGTTRTLSKLFWAMEQDAENWEKTDKVLFASSYLVFRLTGEKIADAANITFSGLNDVKTGGWCGRLIELFGIDASKLPAQVVGPMDIVGGVTKAAAADTGLLPGTPVIAGCCDVTAECYSVNIYGKSQLKLRLGSCGAANAVFEGPASAWPQCTPYLPGAGNLMGRYTMACARSVKWARDLYFSECPKEDCTYEQMDREALSSPLGARGLFYHPYLNGEDCPYHNPNLRAKIIGIDTCQSRGDVVKAVYEGVSFSLLDLILSEPDLASLSEMIYVGGGTKSAVWMSTLADVLGKNGLIPLYGDASYGVALMAADAAGICEGRAAAERTKQLGKPVEFNADRHAAYMERFAIYRKLALLECGIAW